MIAPSENDCPPAVGATGGQHTAVGANAMTRYANDADAGKPRFNPPLKAYQNTTPRDGTDVARIAFRASGGRLWAYRGKRARVLAMLATNGHGVTQWDCYPWHTRLAASVKVMRDDGIEIETTLEGPYRHARYRLRTPGTLIIQGQNTGGGNFWYPEKSA